MFLRNHADAIGAIDLCVVPTLTFECLFVFFVVGHGRRQLPLVCCDPAPERLDHERITFPFALALADGEPLPRLLRLVPMARERLPTS